MKTAAHWMAVVALLLAAPSAGSAQAVGGTTTLAPFSGHLFTPASSQRNIGFYGTDLGFSVYDGTDVRFYFGDSWSDNVADSVDIPKDDTLGFVSGGSFPNGDSVDNYVHAHPPGSGKLSWQAAAPPITFRLNAFGLVAGMPLYRGGVAGPLLNMGLGRTPSAAFANRLAGSSGAVFGVFHRVVAMECSGGAAPSCASDFTCDTGLGSCFPLSGELDVPCVIGTSRCLCVAVAGGGMCEDRTSSVYDSSEDGRVLSVAYREEVGNADHSIPEIHYTKSWYTSKFMNPAVATVKDFVATRANGAGNLYTPADGLGTLANQKVLIWGRPNYVAYGARGRGAKLYFAYADMPSYSATGAFNWTVHYFTGVTGGVPQFSTSQAAAVALNLSAAGADPSVEQYDVVNQMSIAWVPALSKWVMLYGGDQTPGGLELFVGPNYPAIRRDPNGAIHARFASQPWGPWLPPQQVLAAGNPATVPPAAGTQYAPGGILFHPNCSGSNCAPAEPAYSASEYGHLYAPNIIDKWTTTRNGTSADIYWTVSTSNPYETVLMKTRLNP